MDTSHGAPDGLDPSLVAMAHQIVRSGGMEALIEVQRSMDPEFLASGPHLRLCEQRPGYREFCEHKTAVTSPDMWITMSDEMLSQRDRLEALRGLSMPVLVIAGQEDQAFVGQCRAMAATIPGARLAEITGGGHSPQFEAPEQWWEAVCAFLWEVKA
jgi:pimeloyl-ACP methyl ester carboxylesterase